MRKKPTSSFEKGRNFLENKRRNPSNWDQYVPLRRQLAGSVGQESETRELQPNFSQRGMELGLARKRPKKLKTFYRSLEKRTGLTWIAKKKKGSPGPRKRVWAAEQKWGQSVGLDSHSP